MRSLAIAVLFLVASSAPASDLPEWERLLVPIRPPAEQLRWQQIPWLTDLAAGMRVSQEEKRPLLLWAAVDEPLDRC
jgi:hypothetical protein